MAKTIFIIKFSLLILFSLLIINSHAMKFLSRSTQEVTTTNTDNGTVNVTDNNGTTNNGTGTDQGNNNGTTTTNTNDQNTSTFKPIRIKFLTNELEQEWLKVPSYAEKTQFIVKKLLPLLQFYLADLIKVQPRTQPIKTDTNDNITCINNSTRPIPYELTSNSNGVADADVVVLVYGYIFGTIYNSPFNPSVCQLDQQNQDRPLIVTFGVNMIYDFEGQFQQYFALAKGNMFRTLAFDFQLYSHFINQQSGQLLGIDNVYQNGSYTLPNLVQYAQQYFDCPSITSVPIVDRDLFHNELMFGQIYDPQFVVSNFTLIFLESTGWYQVNSSLAENFIWGKGKGCEFYNKQCKAQNNASFWEFSSNEFDFNCTYGYATKGRISKTYFGNQADDCLSAITIKDCRDPKNNDVNNTDLLGESYGSNSQCVESTLVHQSDNSSNQVEEDTRCYSFECSNNSIQFQVGQANVTCSQPGEVVTIDQTWTGNLTCPWDFSLFCSKPYQICPENCNFNGYCFEGQCQCMPGFTGDKCTDFNCSSVAEVDVCNPFGQCTRSTGMCECAGFDQPNCVFRTCAANCSGNGYCSQNGECFCKQGFEGQICDKNLSQQNSTQQQCPGSCNNGTCNPNTGTCTCVPGFEGPDCSQIQCPINCNNHGTCDQTTGTCTCDQGWDGPACQAQNLSCPNNCNNQGTCNPQTGTCQCAAPFTNADCSA